MGKFMYDKATRVEIEDRALDHVQVAMETKLRRHESFTFTWRDDPSGGDGYTTVWIHPASRLRFTYRRGHRAALNSEWLDALIYTANHSTGMYLVPEPAGVVSLDRSL